MAEPEWREDEAPPDIKFAANTDVEALFREHNESLVRFLRARLHNDADAREAAQEAYVRLLQLDQPDQPSFLRAYLFKIASNVATDFLRRRAVRAKASGDEAPDQWIQPTQERGMAARQQLDTIHHALSELPPRCREAFLLSRHHGLGTVEIAESLGVSDRMVRMYLVRALEHVQAAWGRTSQAGEAQ